LQAIVKLQDFLQTDRRYDHQDIAADDELSRQIQVRLINLGLLDPPADGIFGPISSAAFERFQMLMETGEKGYLGALTAKKVIETKRSDLPINIPTITIKQDTVFKARPLQSSSLPETEKQLVASGKSFKLIDVEPSARKHVRVTLRNDAFPKLHENGEVKPSKIWYAFSEHVTIYNPKDKASDTAPTTPPKGPPASVKLNVPYKSQLDNWYNPTGSCNVTSIAMCLQFLGLPRRDNIGQYEDELYEYAIYRGLSRHNPYDLAKIVRDYGGKDEFRENATIDEVKAWLVKGNPAVIHGYFTSFGHIIVVVGYNETGFVVHDPYGEWFSSGYRTDLSGAYKTYSYNLIRRTCIPDGNFWVHFISK
jgi:uncharacterized protein YvpB